MIFFLLLQAVWIMKITLTQVDPQFVAELAILDPIHAYSILSREYRVVFRMIEEFGNISLFVSLVPLFVKYKKSQTTEKIIYLIFFIYSTAGIISLIEYLGFFPAYFTPQNSFWVGTKRFGGIFTDPNALGICAAFCLVLSLHLHKRLSSNKYALLYLLCALLWVFLGLISGSRTFFLIIGITFVAFYGFQIPQQGRLKILSGMIGICALILLTFIPYLRHFTGVERLLSSLQPFNASPGSESRFIFFHVNLKLFSQHPLIGVGLNQFDQLFSATASSLGYAVGKWKDNPNSFYLGIFSELGLVGVLLFLIDMLSVRFRYERTLLSAAGVAFLISLAIGCHLDFFEVALISSLFVAHCIEGTKRIPGKYKIIGIIILIVSSVCIIELPESPHGFFMKGGALYVRREGYVAVSCRKEIFIDAPLMSHGEDIVEASVDGDEYRFFDATPQKLKVQKCLTTAASEVEVHVLCSRFFLADRPYCIRIR